MQAHVNPSAYVNEPPPPPQVLTARETVSLMLAKMLEQEKFRALPMYRFSDCHDDDSTKTASRIAVIVNNLGSTTVLQLSIVAREAVLYLGELRVCHYYDSSLATCPFIVTLLAYSRLQHQFIILIAVINM